MNGVLNHETYRMPLRVWAKNTKRSLEGKEYFSEAIKGMNT
jgi:hypothetical protein